MLLLDAQTVPRHILPHEHEKILSNKLLLYKQIQDVSMFFAKNQNWVGFFFSSFTKELNSCAVENQGE